MFPRVLLVRQRADLEQDCDGRTTPDIAEADYIVVDPPSAAHRPVPTATHPVTYVSSDWVLRRATSSEGHPIEEGVIDPFNTPPPSPIAPRQSPSLPSLDDLRKILFNDKSKRRKSMKQPPSLPGAGKESATDRLTRVSPVPRALKHATDHIRTHA